MMRSFAQALLVFAIFGYERAAASEVRLPDALDFVVIQVNGQHRQVSAGEILEVVWGDRLNVQFAQLVNGSREVGLINVVGYRARSDSPDDRDAEFRTNGDLNPDWAHDASKQVYRINIQTKSRLHGRVFIQVKEPELQHIVLRINGQRQIVKPSERVLLRASDKLQVESIVSNIEATDPSFRYLLPKQGESRARELRFYRHDRLIASIPFDLHE